MTDIPAAIAPSRSYAPHLRAERLIASSRVFLASISLLAIWLDPTTPRKYAGFTYGALAAYTVYSIVLLAGSWSAQSPERRRGIVTHAIDLAVFTLLVYLTEGPTSPFFVFFTFAIVAATMRWHWKGAVWTALIAMSAFLAMGMYASLIMHDAEFELNRFLMRAAYLGVTTVLIGYLGTHEKLWRNDWMALANLGATFPVSASDILQTALRESARVLDARRALLVWEEGDEPWTFTAIWSAEGFRTGREQPGYYEPLTASDLEDVPFGSDDVRRAGREGLAVLGDGVRPDSLPINATLGAQFHVGAVLSAPIKAPNFRGRLFLLDGADATTDNLILTALVARHVTATIHDHVLMRNWRATALADARAEIARGMHDGPLQALGGFAMQLEAVAGAIEGDPPAAANRLRKIQSGVLDEQRDLRFMLGELRQAPADETEPIESTLHRLAERMQEVWGVAVTLRVDVPALALTEPMSRELYQLVREALVNVARHADASSADVAVLWRDDALHVTIADNGRGFPFEGHYDDAALATLRIGPVTVKERVGALGGTLAIDSSSAGSILIIVLPMNVPEPT